MYAFKYTHTYPSTNEMRVNWPSA